MRSSSVQRCVAVFAFALSLPGHAETQLKVYESIAELRAIDVRSPDGVPTNTVAKVLGYYKANDGGGGDFRFVRASGASPDADNGGTIIAPNDQSETPTDESTLGRWLRICEPGFVSVLWFGAKPTPVHASYYTDSLEAIRRAYNALPAVDDGTLGPSEDGVIARSGILYFPFVGMAANNVSAGIHMSATTYWVSDTIKVGERLTLRGDGPSRVGLSLLPNAAPAGTAEKYLIKFCRYPGGPGSAPSANTTFDTGVEGLFLGGGRSPMSSGVFMDAAQMSFVRNCWLNDFGLRCIVGAPYTLENLSCGTCRGPAFDLSFSPRAESGASMAANGDGKVHATNLFFGDVGDAMFGWPRDGDGDHYPAIRLRDCSLFLCSDLRVEQCPKIIKADNCGQVWVTSMNSVNYGSDFEAQSTTAVTLRKVGRAAFKQMSLNLYDTHVRDIVPSGYMGPANMVYPNDVSSWERAETGQTTFTSGNTGTQILGSGANFPFRVVSKPNDGAANTAPYEGPYVAEFFRGNFSTAQPLESAGSRMLGIRKDGQFETINGSGHLPLSNLATTLYQPGIVSVTLPILMPRATYESNVVLPSGTNLRPGDIVTWSLVRGGIVAGVGGPALPLGVFLADAWVSGANQVTLRFWNQGTSASVATKGCQFKLTVQKDAR